MTGRVRARLDDDWLRLRGGWLPWIAALAVAADVVTTAAFLALEAGREANGLLVAGLEHGLAGGALVFALTQGVLLAVAWLSLGAVSTYVGSYLAVTMGVGGGLSNAVLLLTGEALVGVAGLEASTGYLLGPLVATPVGLVAVARVHADPRWPAVALVAGALLGGEVVSFVA